MSDEPSSDRVVTATYEVSDEEPTPIRSDRYIAEVLGLLTRSQLKYRLIRLWVNGRTARPSKVLNVGDVIHVRYSLPSEPVIVPRPVELPVLFENGDLLVIDKPQGLVVHTGSGGEVETVVSGAAYRRPELLSAFPEDPIRPGVVHRLDKETSGVMVLAKHPQAREELVAAFADRRVRKRYLAILKGVPPSDRGTVTAPIQRYPHNRKRYRAVPAQSEAPGGKAAESEYRVIRHFGNYSFVELRPKTGRTHQLRVHMSSLGAPVLGDPTYARRDPRYPDATMMLHAYELHLPVSGRDQIAAFVAPIPHRIRQMLATLRYPSNP